MTKRKKKTQRKNNIVVEVDGPLRDTITAIELIKKLLKINKIKMDLSIAYDFSLEELGMYLPGEDDQFFRIFVNPSNCLTNDDNNGARVEIFARGYTADLTLFGVTIHEFCHLLQYQVCFDIIPQFKKTFPVNRLYLNDYSDNDIRDELAEIMTLYITNPYLLKLISEEHYKFCKKFFKSPVSCLEEQCREIYSTWPIHVKEHMKTHWRIGYDVAQEIFVRL